MGKSVTRHCYRCGRRFVAERTSAKYCSSACKTEYNRHGSDMYKALSDAKHALRAARNLLADNPHWGTNEVYAHIQGLRKLVTELDQLQIIQASAHNLDYPLVTARSGHVAYWQCVECGQNRMFEPKPLDTCSFCKRSMSFEPIVT